LIFNISQKGQLAHIERDEKSSQKPEARKACWRNTPYVASSFDFSRKATKTRRISCSIPSRAARRGEDSLLSRRNKFWLLARNQNPNFRVADVPILEGIQGIDNPTSLADSRPNLKEPCGLK
jgi:hypothetical protein